MLKCWELHPNCYCRSWFGGKNNGNALVDVLPPFKIKLEAVGTVHGKLIKTNNFCGFEAYYISLEK
jgi:hypothetical protein